MKKIIYAMGCALGLVAASCESDMELEKYGSLGYAVNAILTPDTCITVYVSDFYSVGAIPDDRDYDHAYATVYAHVFAGTISPYLVPGAPNTNAAVTYAVNGVDMGHMDMVGYKEEDGSTGLFTADYIPKPGDCVSVHAYNADFPEVEVDASVTVPEAPEFEVVSMEKSYSPKSESDSIDFYVDTLVRIAVKIQDKGNEKNFYRLKCREFSSEKWGFYPRYQYTYDVDDVFQCDDPILAGYPKGDLWWADGYTSIVFNDRTFDGSEKTLTLTRQIIWKSPDDDQKKLIVELEEITEDVYNYLIAIRRYNLADQSVYKEPVIIPSNTSTGFGLLGAFNFKRLVFDSDAIPTAQ